MVDSRAQGALEFLTTYGWAFIVVLVMVGALTHFGVLNPASLAPERCVSPAGFECRDSQVLTEGQSIKFSNKLGYSIQISNASVETNSGNASCTSSPGLVGPDQEFTLICDKTGLVDGEKTKLDVSFSYYKPESGVGFAKSVESQVVSLVSQGSVSGSSGSGNEGSSNGGGSTPVNTSVDSCRTITVGNNVYTLTADLQTQSTSTCMIIAASDVTLDCAGHTIKGVLQPFASFNWNSPDIGIKIQSGYRNIQIKNCIVTNFGFLIDSYNNVNVQIFNNQLKTGHQGVGVAYGSAIEVYQNTFYNVTKYNVIGGFSNSNIYQNSFDAPVLQGESRGVALSWAPNNRVFDNNMKNMGYGLWTCCGDIKNNYFYNNNIDTSTIAVLAFGNMPSSKDNRFENNNIINSTYGLYIWDIYSTNFSSNNVQAKSYGIYFRKETNQNNNRFVNNVITGSPTYGVYIIHDPNTGVFSKNNVFIGTSVTGASTLLYIKQYDPAQSAWYTISSNEFVNDQIHNNTFQ